MGKKLMEGLTQEAVQRGCSRIRWDVLSDNENAQRFYLSLGATENKKWRLFHMESREIKALSRSGQRDSSN